MYHGTSEGACSQVKWNLPGEGLMFDDFTIPVFSITEQSDVDSIITQVTSVFYTYDWDVFTTAESFLNWFLFCCEVILHGARLESRRSRVRIPLAPGFFRVESYQWLIKIGTPVATLPGAWCYRVSARTGRPGVSILWVGEMESLICNFYLSVAARKIVWADLSLRYTRMLLGC